MTRKFLPLIAAALAIAGVAAPADAQRSSREARREARAARGEAELARLLQDRVAGAPVDCIDLRRIRSSHTIDHTALVFDAGGTIYVNRPRGGAEALNRFDGQITRPFNSRLCSVDHVIAYDFTSGLYAGNIFLGEFVPYRRVRDRDRD